MSPLQERIDSHQPPLPYLVGQRQHLLRCVHVRGDGQVGLLARHDLEAARAQGVGCELGALLVREPDRAGRGEAPMDLDRWGCDPGFSVSRGFEGF